jgi:hypothetical protein
MKITFFWDVTPCGACKNHVSEQRIDSSIRVTRIGELGTLAVTINRSTLRRNASVAGYSPILIMMMEAIRSSETSILTSSTRRYIPEDSILRSHRRENFKSYIALTGWTL